MFIYKSLFLRTAPITLRTWYTSCFNVGYFGFISHLHLLTPRASMSRVNKLCINIIAFIVLNPNKYNEAIIWEDISHLFYINVFHRNLTDCMSVCPFFYMGLEEDQTTCR